MTYCVVVEGEKTEKLYFDDAKFEFDGRQRAEQEAARNLGELSPRSCSLVVVVAGGRSFENVISKALQQTNVGHEKIWCVVDADFYARLQGKQRKDADKAYKAALAKGIDVVFSRPCFEVWFRHHFNADSSAWVDGDTAKAGLAKLWPEYLLKPTKHWDLLKPRQDIAISNAGAVRKRHSCPPAQVQDSDACSEVDRLILELRDISPNAPHEEA